MSSSKGPRTKLGYDNEGFYLSWNARGVVVGDTEGPPKCFQGVYPFT